MFAINSIVIYDSGGVCKITDIRKEKFFNEEREYYVLKPKSTEGSTIYVPVDSELLTRKMKYILTSKEIFELIKVIPDEKFIWIQDNRLRNERYKEIFSRNDRKELVQLIKAIYSRKQEQLVIGKKLWAVDEGALTKAEKILFDEFALVLNIKPEEVVPFILQQIHCDEKGF